MVVHPLAHRGADRRRRRCEVNLVLMTKKVRADVYSHFGAEEEGEIRKLGNPQGVVAF